MFTVVLATTATQVSADREIKKMRYTYYGILFSNKNEGNYAICYNLGETGGHYAKVK